MLLPTFVALAVAVLAIVPGAVFVFSYESQLGSYGASLPDRVYRFLAASAVLHAVAAGPTYQLYRSYVATGRLARGAVNPLAVEVAALVYLLVPFIAGTIWGFGARKGWRIIRSFSASSPQPTAWEHVFSREPQGWARIRLKSGTCIGGLVGRPPGRATPSYASGPEPQDLFLSATVRVVPETGELQTDDHGYPVVQDGGILIRWDEIEYLQLFEERGKSNG
jgi:hypothetical protein